MANWLSSQSITRSRTYVPRTVPKLFTWGSSESTTFSSGAKSNWFLIRWPRSDPENWSLQKTSTIYLMATVALRGPLSLRRAHCLPLINVKPHDPVHASYPILYSRHQEPGKNLCKESRGPKNSEAAVLGGSRETWFLAAQMSKVAARDGPGTELE